MRKDIFIDTNIAKNFARPLDPEYGKLIKWLLKFDKNNPSNNAYLMVSNKLIGEYQRSTGGYLSGINMIVMLLTEKGRVVKIDNQEIKNFQQEYFTKRVMRKLTCNEADRDHIPVVLLSERKYALSLDKRFTNDLEDFPGFTVRVERRPQDLSYEL